MTSGEHTKGCTALPWLIPAVSWEPWTGAIEVKNKDGETICYTTSGADVPSIQNANLIVTAVNTYPAVAELVKALEAIEPFIPQSSATDGGPNARSAHVAAADQVRSALTRFREAQAGGGE